MLLDVHTGSETSNGERQRHLEAGTIPYTSYPHEADVRTYPEPKPASGGGTHGTMLNTNKKKNGTFTHAFRERSHYESRCGFFRTNSHELKLPAIV